MAVALLLRRFHLRDLLLVEETLALEHQTLLVRKGSSERKIHLFIIELTIKTRVSEPHWFSDLH
jgi:hypothetical protein